MKSLEGPLLFNPYIDTCVDHDVVSASEIRESNLRIYLESIQTTRSILVGEAPGYLGCRRTGLPFTDNHHLDVVSSLYGLPKFKQATKSGKNNENSALYMWRELKNLEYPPFVWNLIPLHPFGKESQLSNRTPIKRDFEISKTAITYLLNTGEFDQILAIGRVAEKYLIQLGYSVTYVRHPSHGGSTIFKNQLKSLLN
ncbi:MAG: uracil-DNA glycosylase [Candidatus Heimdallarchaeota archaeon]|nr:uracil-DNA glycosylase [Candidatus Heimdallarchaeota archaeon]